MQQPLNCTRCGTPMAEYRKAYQCPDCGHIIEKGHGINLTPRNPITGKYE